MTCIIRQGEQVAPVDERTPVNQPLSSSEDGGQPEYATLDEAGMDRTPVVKEVHMRRTSKSRRSLSKRIRHIGKAIKDHFRSSMSPPRNDSS